MTCKCNKNDDHECNKSIIRMMMTNGRVLINSDLSRSPEFEVNNGGKQEDPLFP